MMNKKKTVYRFYPLKKVVVINGWEFAEMIISSHYEENHPYMTDKKIWAIAKQLDKRNDFVPKLQGKLPDGTAWQSFFWEPFCYAKKAYRLVWYWEIGFSRLWILNCHRRHKYDKKC